MKNHFMFSYFGNKRSEVEEIVKALNFDGITTIIEPFCGSSAISYYISTLYPNRFKYILNDNDEMLMEVYELFKNPKDVLHLTLMCDVFRTYYNKLNTKQEKKEYYMHFKSTQGIIGYFTARKFHGAYPTSPPQPNKLCTVFSMDAPIITFLKNEKVELLTSNGLDVVKQYKHNTNVLMILDPPYMNTYNSFYSSPISNIYEYLALEHERKGNVYMILENNWIIKGVFPNVVHRYTKKYTGVKKKTAEHVVIRL